MTCSLYRFYDEDDRLLYVGITTQACARWAAHAGDKEWFPTVVRATVEHFADRESAAAAEKAAIRTEKPLHNIRHTDRPVERRKRRVPPPTRTITHTLVVKDEAFTVEEAAAHVRVDAEVFLRWAVAGSIPTHRKANGSVVFYRSDLDRWLRDLRRREEVSA